MNRRQHRQITDLFQTINQAQAAKLYADCQNAALALCDFIEAVSTEGIKIVALLEKYCELLYEAHQGKIDEKPLKKHLIKIENSIKSELIPRFEVVFLSYKASMSDCLESIYLAAKDDPGCDAYWIPIPYCTLNPDETIANINYECDGYYGNNIEITNWQTYDIKKRHPDVIFTFSGYDDCNYVTRIHTDFFCKRLRDLTDMLVYVPYGVSFGNYVDESFCIVPGCIYAHKVIVQTEKIKDIYMNAYKENIGEGFGKPEDKFIVLGSPKFDKVINSKREDFTLPDAWRNIINGKKVILYTDTVRDSLNESERYPERLRDIIDFFRNRDDAVLWWRPHPLNEATFKAFQTLRPQLFREYTQIAADFKRENKGIFDDTHDLHRAIAYADACYGVGSSSVTPLYRVTGKPLESAVYEKRFGMISINVSSRDIWINELGGNELFKMDKAGSRLEYVGNFPNRKNGISACYGGKLVESAGIIYFTPHRGTEIIAYSIKDNSFDMILNYEDTDKFNIDLPFLRAVAYGRYMFFPPRAYPGFIRFDMETKEICLYDNWLPAYMELAVDIKEYYFCFSFQHGNTIYLPAYEINAVAGFNMDTGEMNFYEIGRKEYRHVSICHDGEYFWLTPRFQTDTPLIKWNPGKGIVDEISIHNKQNISTEGFIGGFYFKDHIWFLPIMSENAIKVNIHTNEVSIADEFAHGPAPDNSSPYKYTNGTMEDGIGYFYNLQNKTLVEYNFSTNERRDTVLKYNIRVADKLEKLISKISQDSIDTENVNKAVAQFNAHPEGKTGEKICEYVKNNWANSL